MKSPVGRVSSGFLFLCAVVAVCGGSRTARGEGARQSIRVETSVLDSYVGQYQLAPKMVITLRRAGHYLTAQLTGQPEIVVFAENETRFFWKIVEAQFTVEKDKEGKVDGLRFEQGAIKVKAKRISGEVPKAEPVAESEDVLESPRLLALAKELKGGHREAIQKFWEEMKDKAPLQEPIGKDGKMMWVTFLWRGNDDTRRVGLSGGPPTLDGEKWLTRLADTDVWYRSEKISSRARFAYWFQVNRPLKLPAANDPAAQMKIAINCPDRCDPLNPHDLALQYMMVVSQLELPQAPKQEWLDRGGDVPKGTLKQVEIKSEAFKQGRGVTVYTPAGYDAKGAECGLLVLFDGGWYQDADMIPGPVILDSLIAGKKIPPMVAVFVSQPIQTRNADLTCSKPFADFIANDVVQWARKNYHVSSDPKRAIVGGASLGGLMASYCALRHPDVFGNVLSQSGAYQWYPGELESDEKSIPDAEPDWLTREFVATPRREVRFYLEAGRYEDGGFTGLLPANRHFRDVLLAKGYPVTWSQFEGGHDFVSWRASFADALIALAQ